MSPEIRDNIPMRLRRAVGGFLELELWKPLNICVVRGCQKPVRAQKGKSGCSLCTKHATALQRLRDPIKAQYYRLKYSARRRRKTFTITFSEWKKFCEATGYHNSTAGGSHGPWAESMSIDRIDNRRGYSIDNIRVISHSENARKANHQEEIESIIERI